MPPWTSSSISALAGTPVSSVALAVNRHDELREHRLDGQDKVRKFLSQKHSSAMSSLIHTPEL
jgi:hypothetical protein